MTHDPSSHRARPVILDGLCLKIFEGVSPYPPCHPPRRDGSHDEVNEGFKHGGLIYFDMINTLGFQPRAD